MLERLVAIQKTQGKFYDSSTLPSHRGDTSHS